MGGEKGKEGEREGGGKGDRKRERNGPLQSRKLQTFHPKEYLYGEYLSFLKGLLYFFSVGWGKQESLC